MYAIAVMAMANKCDLHYTSEQNYKQDIQNEQIFVVFIALYITRKY